VDVAGVCLQGQVDPVGRGGVVLGEAALGSEEVALEVVRDARQAAGAVVDPLFVDTCTCLKMTVLVTTRQD